MSLLVGPRVDKEIPRRPLLAPGRRPSVAPRGLRVVVTPRVRGHRPMRPTIASQPATTSDSDRHGDDRRWPTRLPGVAVVGASVLARRRRVRACRRSGCRIRMV